MGGAAVLGVVALGGLGGECLLGGGDAFYASDATGATMNSAGGASYISFGDGTSVTTGM